VGRRVTDDGGPDWTSADAWSRRGWRIHLVAGSGPRPWSAEGTIPELAAASACRVPGRVAVSVDGQPVSHGQLGEEARQAAAWLAARLAPGDRMLLAAGSSLGFLRWYLGALRACVVVVLANPGYTAAELEHLATDSGARLAVADPGPAQRLAGLATLAGLPVVAAAESPPGLLPDAARALPAADDTALLAYTSGTTGRPKGVPLTHRQLAASIQGAMAAWRWTGRDVLVHALPLFHQHGLGGVHAVLVAGGTAHIGSRFTAAGLAVAVRQQHATVLFAVPTMYQALLDDEKHHGRLLAGLRLAVCGSAPLTALLAKRSASQLGRAPLVRYGLTETGLNVSHTATDIRPGSVGIPFPGVLVRVWAESAPVPPGADGEIQIRGPHVFRGYPGDPSATAGAFTADGWFRTGDIGQLDPGTGHLVIRGRIKEMIITGGLNVYPREVETVLEEHPSVAEAAVAGGGGVEGAAGEEAAGFDRLKQRQRPRGLGG